MRLSPGQPEQTKMGRKQQHQGDVRLVVGGGGKKAIIREKNKLRRLLLGNGHSEEEFLADLWR